MLHGEWAEVKTLAIGTIEEPNLRGEVHARDLSYFSRMMEHRGFARLATVETHRRGTERAGEVCAVVDGAEWQQKFIDLHRPGAVRILDWCHAAVHLAKASQAAFGSGTAAASEWLGVQLHHLKHGEPEQTLRDLRALCRELGQELDQELARKGAGGDGAEAAKAVRSSLEYLEKRKGQIRYAEFQAEGYPIGSGAVESANKLVVEGRLKGSGMHWAREHVNPMVALRTVVCGDRWEEVWPQISQRLRQKSGGQPAGRQTKPGDQEPQRGRKLQWRRPRRQSERQRSLPQGIPARPTVRTMDRNVGLPQPLIVRRRRTSLASQSTEENPSRHYLPTNPTRKSDAHPTCRDKTRR